MEISSRDIAHLAHLARVAMDDDQNESLAHDLTQIMGMVEHMREMDSSGIEPLVHTQTAEQRMRADEVAWRNMREEALVIAPMVEKGYYLVPQVIGGGGGNTE